MVALHRSPSAPNAILSALDAQRLRQACPKLDSWPTTWQYGPADLDVGHQIVQALSPFLLALMDQGLAPRTVRRHRDNLWLLGGELIRRRYDDDALAKMDAITALCELVEEDGGPLMLPRISEADQDSLDATCRKLHRFLQTAHK
jgi:hypothetical protein